MRSAALTFGVRPDQILKSLLFHGKDGTVILVVVRGLANVDQRKRAAVSGLAKPRLAAPAVVQAVTGYTPGATSPVGHPSGTLVVVDRAVLDESVVFGCGAKSMR